MWLNLNVEMLKQMIGQHFIIFHIYRIANADEARLHVCVCSYNQFPMAMNDLEYCSIVV